MRRLYFTLASLLLILAVAVEARPQSGDPEAAPQVVFIFEGNRVVSDQDLRGVMDKYLGKHSALLKDEAIRSIVDYCLRKQQNFLRGKGYLGATVKEAGSRKTERGLEVTAAVEEGVRYRLGEVFINGATVFPNEQLSELLDVKPGEVADGEKIGAWVYDRMRKLYADAGYVQYSPEVKPEFKEPAKDGEDGSVDFFVDIDEGRRFVMRRIEFMGNSTIRDNLLRRTMVIAEGDPYSERLFEESIRRLNKLGVFEKIDGERDVDFRYIDGSDSQRAAGEDALMDITISVKELKR